MRLDEKARENLEAAERLLPDEEGRDALPNAAASRAYYAAYLAVADQALRSGESFTHSEKGYFTHDSLPDDAHGWGLIDDDARDKLTWLRGLRIKADYHEGQVPLEEASDAYEAAQSLVQTALGGDP